MAASMGASPKEAAIFDQEKDVDNQALILSADTPSTRVRVQVVRAINQHTTQAAATGNS